MRSGIGGNLPAKQVSFQVSVNPDISQVGSYLNLLNESTLSGTDNYSGENLTQTASGVTSDITLDSSYIAGSGKVIK